MAANSTLPAGLNSTPRGGTAGTSASMPNGSGVPQWMLAPPGSAPPPDVAGGMAGEPPVIRNQVGRRAHAVPPMSG